TRIHLARMPIRPEKHLDPPEFVPVRRVPVLLALSVVAWATGAPQIAHSGDLVITPRVEGQELFTDNALLTPSHRRSDLITTFSPGVAVSENAARLQGKLDYSPSFYLYALTPGQNVIGHNLYANGT